MGGLGLVQLDKAFAWQTRMKYDDQNNTRKAQ